MRGCLAAGRRGLLLYLAHLLASLLVGLLFRFHRPDQGPRTLRSGLPQFQAVPFPRAFTRSVTGSLQSVLNICAFVLFFTVFLRILTHAGVLPALAGGLSALFTPLGLSPLWAQRLLTGLVELSSGVTSLTDGTLPGRLSMAAFMLGWAGTVRPLSGAGLSGGQRPVHGHLCGGQVAPRGAVLLNHVGLCRLFPLEEPAAAYLAQQTEAIAPAGLLPRP